MLKRTMVVIAGAVLATAAASRAAVLYSDNFNTDTSASYNKFVTAGASGPSGDAVWAYDYSALGIPSAPNSGDGSTLGLRERTDSLQNSVGTVVGAVEVATKTLTLTAPYQVSADVWGNYIGGTTINDANGSNGSTAAAMGIGTSGNQLQYTGGSNDGILSDTFADAGGGTNLQYRIYTNNTHPLPSSGQYAAGTGANSASNTDPYYSFMGTHTAPTVQSTASSTQTGTTPVGIIGFAWHTVSMTQDGTNVSWYIDNHLITTTPDTAFTTGGSQVSLGNDDSNLSANTTANGQLYNAMIWDNLTVSDTITAPEPASMSLLGVGAVGLLARRRNRR